MSVQAMNLQFHTAGGEDYLEFLHRLEFFQFSCVLAVVAFSALGLRFLQLKLRGNAEATTLAVGWTKRRGIASLEFLLVLIPLLIIILAFIQIALMMNARLHVGYAAYAAARSASTVVYSETDNEPIGVLLNSGEENAEKWQRIERATASALLPISPGSATAAAKAYASFSASRVIDDQSFGGVDFGIDGMAAAGRLTAMVIHRAGDAWDGTRIQRSAVKSLYTDLATTVWINDRNSEGGMRDGSEQSGNYDLSSSDTLSVRVDYEFWLSVPYAGRAMKLAFDAAWILQSRFLTPTLTISDTVVVTAWRKRKAF